MDDIQLIQQNFDNDFNNLNNNSDEVNVNNVIQNLKVKYLGRNGVITNLYKNLKNIDQNLKKDYGSQLNTLKEYIINKINIFIDNYKNYELNKIYEKEKIDITYPGIQNTIGTLHPLTIVKNKIINYFVGLGFSIHETNEIDSDYYCFTGLNIPKDHPARSMQDTFYITDDIMLRPHTSSGQVRAMQTMTPPFKILSPGKVYRSDSEDMTHTPMFHQIEGLVIDKNVSLCDLKGILESFLNYLFETKLNIRFRQSYFPFTEPSVEVDFECIKCNKQGCSLCKHTGWIEVMGAGIVNVNVLKMNGIDTTKYTGFAFGLGLERLTMLKYGITDIRILYENNIKFLQQFIRR